MGTCSICRRLPAILEVRLRTGARVFWCGSCIDALRRRHAVKAAS